MGAFLDKLMWPTEVKPLLSCEVQYSVDDSLLQAWATHASLERTDGKEDPPTQPSSGPGRGIRPAQ
jgi:hypothetical protein